MNQMMVSTLYINGAWFAVEGEGYRKSGAITSVAGAEVPDFTRLALGLVLDSDATVADDGGVVGDPTEAALVVLAAKLGVDAEETRRAYPRLAEVPFDSDYKFMATFHHYRVGGVDRVIELVKGAPDVVLARCSQSGGSLTGAQTPIEQVKADIDAANARMGEKGLRVLAFAARFIEEHEIAAMTQRPDGVDAGSDLRRHGGHHRPAAGRGQERGPDRTGGRDRRADDHRRPRRHRRGDRRDARVSDRV